MRKVILAAAALSVFALPAAAQVMQPGGPTYYGTLGYSQLDHSDGDLGAITGRLGAKFNPYLGVEGEGSIGVRDDKFTIAGAKGKIEHDYDLAAYVVGTVPVTPNFELFARGGYGTTRMKAELAGVERKADGESWNYGVGANYYFDGQNGLRGDWTRRDFTDDGGEVDVYSVNYVRRF